MLDVVTARIEFGDEAGLAVATTAFNRGFADYKYATRFSTDQMRRFLERSGCALENCAVLAANERGVCAWRRSGHPGDDR